MALGSALILLMVVIQEIGNRRIPVTSGDPPNQIPLTRAIAKASAKRPSRKA